MHCRFSSLFLALLYFDYLYGDYSATLVAPEMVSLAECLPHAWHHLFHWGILLENGIPTHILLLKEV